MGAMESGTLWEKKGRGETACRAWVILLAPEHAGRSSRAEEICPSERLTAEHRCGSAPGEQLQQIRSLFPP